MFRLLVFSLFLAGCVAIPINGNDLVEVHIEPDPESYTIGFVETALAFYADNGLDKTVEYYSSEESRLYQYYVFIVDAATGLTIAHPDPIFIGYNTKESVDATGYAHGIEIMSADEDGKWVEYVWVHPETNELHQKHTWAIRRDGLIFASGWYGEEVIVINR